MSEAKINPNCPCTYNCPRHGNCKECRENHARSGSPTYCDTHPESK